MSTGICLPPDTMKKFRSALISGKINPAKLSSMTSQERHEFFKGLSKGDGEAKWINSQFEQKMLLKDKQAGYLRWAKKLTGVSPEVRRDLISRIEKMDDRILDPENEKQFLKDLAATKLGIGVSTKEAKQIANMSRTVQELAAKQRKDGTFPSETDRMNYGYAKYDMGEYLSKLKNRAEKATVKESVLHPIETGSKAAGFVKALKASLDDSAVFRQGWKTIFTNPVVWQKNARKSISDLIRVGVKKEDVVREVMADVVSRPNYDKYQKMKLALGNAEEQFPTSLPGKIPLLGRAYNASEQAYEAFLYRTRADVADKLLQVAKKTDVNINDKEQLQSMGKLINALTGRGDIGHGKAASPIVNNAFFSIRFIKSNFDTLTAHQLQKGVTPFVRKQAAENLVKVVMGTAAILAIADFLKPNSVEWNPTSKDFGKIKIGHTRFDVSGGMGSMVVLASQILGNQEKSTTTGITSKFGQGYGSKTGLDAVNNYFENKLSPAAGVVRDLIERKTAIGGKVTPAGEAANLLVPLPIQTGTQAHGDPHAANQLLISIADGLGIATNTFGKSSKSYSNSLPDSKALQQFKQKVGAQKFKEANNKYNTMVDDWMAQHQKELNSLPQSEQQDTLTGVKTRLQHQLYKDYGFKYKAPKVTGARKQLLDTVK